MRPMWSAGGKPLRAGHFRASAGGGEPLRICAVTAAAPGRAMRAATNRAESVTATGCSRMTRRSRAGSPRCGTGSASSQAQGSSSGNCSSAASLVKPAGYDDRADGERSSVETYLPAAVDRAALLAWYRANRARSAALFGIIDPDVYYEAPIPLRHPFVFYEGHLPAFSFITLVRNALGEPSIDRRLEDLFNRGIDPDSLESARSHRPAAW